MHEQIQVAVKHYQSGNLNTAKDIVSNYLQRNPDDVDANLLMASIHAANSEYEMVVQVCNNILGLNPGNSLALYNAAVASQCLSSPDKVIYYCEKLLNVDPVHIYASLMLVSSLYITGDANKAISHSYSTLEKTNNNTDVILQISRIFRNNKEYQVAREIIQKSVDMLPMEPALIIELAWIDIENSDIESAEKHLQSIPAESHINHDYIHARARIYRVKDQFNEGISYLEEALTRLDNKTAAIVSELAHMYMYVADYGKAKELYEYNIKKGFKLAESNHNLGNIFELMGEYKQAIESYQRVLSVAPGSVPTLYNLSLVYEKNGDNLQSLKYIRQCLMYSKKAEFQQSYVRLLANAGTDIANQVDEEELRGIVNNAECNSQPLSGLVIAILLKCRIFSELVECASKDQYSNFTRLMQSSEVKKVVNNTLFQSYLLNLRVTNYSFEKFITMCRRWLLDAFVSTDDEYDNHTELCAALGIQCYVTGYIFSSSVDEQDAVSKLKDRCMQQKNMTNDIYLLSILSMYIPLYCLSIPDTIGIDMYSETLKRLFKLQFFDRIEENAIYDSIKSPFEIDNQISVVVRDQYEDSPYPVWDKLAISEPRPIYEVINDIAPFHDNSVFAFTNPSVLIAGCGTGSHVILSAMRVRSESITAIDLSKRSLAFAIRKADEYHMPRLEFLHMDILKLPELGRTFDIIESIGVIHHMDEPEKGLECLVSCMRKGGLINLAVYSTIARRYIIKVKDNYDRPERHVSDDEVRDARRKSMTSDESELVLNLSSFTDFYALHECRDLIFHKCEHNYRMLELEQLISGRGLEFLGFDLPDRMTSAQYRKMFPDDKNMTNFQNWDAFENRYPDTFSSMYNFWCYKK